MPIKFPAKALLTALAIYLSTSCCQGSSSKSDYWLEQVPAKFSNWTNWPKIEDASFFEVPESKAGTALLSLSDAEFISQDEQNLAYYRRTDFKCASPNRLYLIRAGYINSGNGDFELHWSGPVLIVAHASLGRDTHMHKTALIACLPHKLSAVYGAIGGAM